MRTTTFLSVFWLAALLSCSAPVEQNETLSADGTHQYWQSELKPFYHGVASGDPLADRVIIWTRVTPVEPGETMVKWSLATDEEMENVVQSGEKQTDETRDFTVKVDVTELTPATFYYYRFAVGNAQSPVGRTKTAPASEVDQLKFAIVSCSNFEAGYFNGFARIGEMDDIDAVLHLGDYIYEYEPGRYGDTSLKRFHLPAKEIVALSDYRTRYSQYRLDPDFQRAHQQHPFITIWDDHEIANNSYQTGAENHQPESEGNYQDRKAAARQAYYEWLPVRESDGQQLYRTIRYGDMADLIMLDERLAGRSAQVDSFTHPDYNAADRSMLGGDQLTWFKGQLQSSKAVWKVIGNQVIFSGVDLSMTRPNNPVNLDAWDGYPVEKQHIIDFLKNEAISDVIFVTGDTHMSWAYEVPESIEAYRRDSTATVAVEFGTTSITSANLDERMHPDTVRLLEQRLQFGGHNPHLKYTNMRDHGYLLLTLDRESALADWRYVETVAKRSSVERSGKQMRLSRSSHELE